MTIAKRLHTRSRATGRKQTIVSIITDEHNVHCLTEAQLDAWWASLAPHIKADLFERELEADEPEADPIGNSFVRLREAETLLNEARQLTRSAHPFDRVTLDAQGKPLAEGGLMPWLKMQDGTVAHICTRGSRNPIKGCSRCGFLSTKLCDYAYPGGRACNAPLCDDHAIKVGPDRDYCPHHPLTGTTPNLFAEVSQ